MKVIVAEHAGFCFGVKRALDLVMKAADEEQPLYTLGPLIHNPQVVEKLQERGVRVIRDVSEAASGRVVMPSHGVPKSVAEQAARSGLRPLDAACPYVVNVHKRVAKLAAEGFKVVVVGDPGHSEVKGILSAAGENAVAISSPEEAARQTWTGRVGIVSQTTQTADRFGEIVGIIARTAAEVRAFNTICYATRDRQDAAIEIAPRVDAMVVVGGRNSANTTRLREICESAGVPTFHIETANELDPLWFSGMQTVGLTAGASTPDWVIQEVRRRLEEL